MPRSTDRGIAQLAVRQLLSSWPLLTSDRTCELRPNDYHGTNAEISPDFRMVFRSGQAEVLHRNNR